MFQLHDLAHTKLWKLEEILYIQDNQVAYQLEHHDISDLKVVFKEHVNHFKYTADDSMMSDERKKYQRRFDLDFTNLLEAVQVVQILMANTVNAALANLAIEHEKIRPAVQSGIICTADDIQLLYSSLQKPKASSKLQQL